MHVRAALWIGVLVSCAGDPPPIADETPAGAPMQIRLLGAGFVEFDGRRATVEEAVYELRVRCRDAGTDPDRRPWLRIVAPEDGPADLGDAAERLRGAAYDAGVHHLELALEGR